MIDLEIRQEGAKPGAVLMDEDRDLLERAERDELRPLLRLYEWEVPTISLGYHQKEDSLDFARMAEAKVPWVRRPTGGAAVLHSEELTYAIVLPNVADPGMAALVLQWVARAITSGLRKAGVPAETDERGEPLSALPNRTSCFVRTSKWEVTVDGKKMVGSAQRKLSKAILQHGSILTGDDHLRIVDFLAMSDDRSREMLRTRLASKATSASSVLGKRIVPSDLRDAMAESFHETFAQWPETGAELLRSAR